MIQRFVGVCVLVSSVSCQGGDCSVDLVEGAAEALVDGSDWMSEGATFMWAGSSLQINIPGNAGWMFTLTGRKTQTGMAVLDAADVQDFPILVDLTGQGGFAVAYPAEGSSSYSTTQNGSGSLEITEADSGLRACFSFVGVNDAGQALEVDGGQVFAAQSR